MKTLPTQFQQIIHLNSYARYIEEEQRRETWDETVTRYVTYFADRFPDYETFLMTEVRDAILNLEVMPSMRALMTAGAALDRDNVAAYNCAFLNFDRVSSFSEMMYILTCGAGVGFSVESRLTTQLPGIPTLRASDETIVVKDSKYGWSEATKSLLYRLYSGEIPKWDLSRLRPKGARLRTFGGRASGPDPLNQLFRFIIEIFQQRQNEKLRPIDVHDIACMIGECVISGGVRRSALISLSDPTDELMANAKTAAAMEAFPWRSNSNNSAVYTDKPDLSFFLKECLSIYNSGSGERGFFNREACQIKAKSIGRDWEHDFGTNPCSEIILRPFQFCNLTEVIARPTDKEESLLHKISIATLLGTLQSTLTDFKVLHSAWRKNCEEERLLGVSVTGIFDRAPWPYELLNKMRISARAINEKYAEEIGINPSKAITCVKPSGTVSLLTDTANGIHPRFAPYYVRRMEFLKGDPLAEYIKAHGATVKQHPKKSYSELAEFPMKSPAFHTAKDFDALEHLHIWEGWNNEYCEHKPSVSIYYTKEDFLHLITSMWEMWDSLSGIAIFPKSEHVYAGYAPMEEITKEEYKERLKNQKPIDFSDFKEIEDNTTSSQELACHGGACEI